MTTGSGGRITLRGMRFAGHHGVSEEERSYAQVIELDLEVEADLEPAARGDAIGDTIDYGPLIELVRAVVEDRMFSLLEGIAGAVLDAVLAAAPSATAATIRVRKLAVPVDADIDYAEVVLRRERAA